MLVTLDTPIAVVAHDAGAANLISSWLDGSLLGLVHGSFSGPAKDIFGRQCPWMHSIFLDTLLPQCKTLLTGTGWSSAFEHEARKLAKQLGRRSIAVIDHWVNYQMRFIRDGEEVLPDEIWVTDEYAKKIAEIEFPNLPIRQQRNSYLENLVRDVRKNEGRGTKHAGTNVLYVLEPIRQSWGSNQQPGEFQALDFFLGNVNLLRLGGDLAIKLRQHPSEVRGKYWHWIESKKGRNISLDEFATLGESIAWADVVVGCQTYAMVVALAAGRCVVSTIPPWAPRCVLPQNQILKLADLVR